MNVKLRTVVGMQRVPVLLPREAALARAVRRCWLHGACLGFSKSSSKLHSLHVAVEHRILFGAIMLL